MNLLTVPANVGTVTLPSMAFYLNPGSLSRKDKLFPIISVMASMEGKTTKTPEMKQWYSRSENGITQLVGGVGEQAKGRVIGMGVDLVDRL